MQVEPNTEQAIYDPNAGEPTTKLAPRPGTREMLANATLAIAEPVGRHVTGSYAKAARRADPDFEWRPSRPLTKWQKRKRRFMLGAALLVSIILATLPGWWMFSVPAQLVSALLIYKWWPVTWHPDRWYPAGEPWHTVVKLSTRIAAGLLLVASVFIAYQFSMYYSHGFLKGTILCLLAQIVFHYEVGLRQHVICGEVDGRQKLVLPIARRAGIVGGILLLAVLSGILYGGLYIMSTIPDGRWKLVELAATVLVMLIVYYIGVTRFPSIRSLWSKLYISPTTGRVHFSTLDWLHITGEDRPVELPKFERAISQHWGNPLLRLWYGLIGCAQLRVQVSADRHAAFFVLDETAWIKTKDGDILVKARAINEVLSVLSWNTLLNREEELEDRRIDRREARAPQPVMPGAGGAAQTVVVEQVVKERVVVVVQAQAPVRGQPIQPAIETPEQPALQPELADDFLASLIAMEQPAPSVRAPLALEDHSGDPDPLAEIRAAAARNQVESKIPASSRRQQR